MEHFPLDVEPSRGRVQVARAVVEGIVADTAAECYGVVGLAARGGRMGRMLARARPTTAVHVEETRTGIAVRVQVVVEHGLNLAEVASTVRSHVAYEVGRLTGLTVASVDVGIDHVRSSG